MILEWIAEPLVVNGLAYIGPGAGLSMIGTLLAVVGVLLLALLAPAIYVAQLFWSLIRRRSTTGLTRNKRASL